MGYDINQSDADGAGIDELDAVFKTSITNNGEVKEESNMTAEDFQKNGLGMHHADTLIMYKVQVISEVKLKRLINNQVEIIRKYKSGKKNKIQMTFMLTSIKIVLNPLNNQMLNDQTEFKDALRDGLRKDPHSPLRI